MSGPGLTQQQYRLADAMLARHIEELADLAGIAHEAKGERDLLYKQGMKLAKAVQQFRAAYAERKEQEWPKPKDGKRGKRSRRAKRKCSTS